MTRHETAGLILTSSLRWTSGSRTKQKGTLAFQRWRQEAAFEAELAFTARWGTTSSETLHTTQSAHVIRWHPRRRGKALLTRVEARTAALVHRQGQHGRRATPLLHNSFHHLCPQSKICRAHGAQELSGQFQRPGTNPTTKGVTANIRSLANGKVTIASS